MRSLMDTQLDNLHKEVLEMGALCESAIANAVKAVCNNDMVCAKNAIEYEILINKKERDIEDACLKLLLRHQPVAKDLRKISATLKMITDMERIGDQARDIAEISEIVDLSKYKNSCHIKDIGTATIKMVTDSIEAYVKFDLQICCDVIEFDNVVDDLFEKIKEDIVSLVSEDNTKTLKGMYILMIAKYFERIGDHATNIAEWVEFSITGNHKGDDIG